jgi:hypothetical protein
MERAQQCFWTVWQEEGKVQGSTSLSGLYCGEIGALVREERQRRGKPHPGYIPDNYKAGPDIRKLYYVRGIEKVTDVPARRKSRSTPKYYLNIKQCTSI